MRHVQMQLSMEREAGKMDTKCLAGSADAWRLAGPCSSFQRVTATDRTRVGVAFLKKKHHKYQQCCLYIVSGISLNCYWYFIK